MRFKSPSLAAPAAIAVLLLVGACGGGSSATPASTPAPTPTAAPNVVATSAMVAGASMTILTDDKGLTLYRWATDKGTAKINCVGGCAAVWPPFVLPATSTTPAAGAGVTGTLTVLANPDGKGQQVLYNGWPLYYYSKDKAPGDTTGQGVAGKWFVVTPSEAPNV
jgi:predicted lipoprotein with Yx(FWY)xxD motif